MSFDPSETQETEPKQAKACTTNAETEQASTTSGAMRMPAFPDRPLIYTQLAGAIKTHQAQAYWRVVNSGGRVPKQEFVTTPPLPDGARLRATDRDYVILPNGAWKRVTPKRSESRTREQSNIFCPHWPVKNKYPKRGA